jgi:hypothetical protein
MYKNIFFLFGVALFFSTRILSQNMGYQQGYFMYPFNPGKQNSLSGSMGELRSNHFHGGIDVRTSGTVGLPILASAQGYVSKVVVTSYSYGNMVHITHPNGYVTVYAHLDKFYGKIASYVLDKQYEKESFELELELPKNFINLQKGDTIGLSGNTGASRGPHLHFEVRDANNRMYNPMLWGFPEIKDNIAPLFDRLAIRCLEKNARVNDAFGRMEFKPIKKNGIYTLNTIEAWGQIGIEIQTHDMMNLTANMMGISYITVWLDDKEILYHDITTYGFEENRYINAKLDYETLMKRGLRFERCYITDGDKLSTYRRHVQKGKIFIKDNRLHEVKIEIADVSGNKSLLQLNIQGKQPEQALYKPYVSKAKIADKIDHELFENILKITTKQMPDAFCRIYSKGKVKLLYPEYYKNGQAIFLHDMRLGVADSIEYNNAIKRTAYTGMIPSAKAFTYVLPGMKINFPAEALFDTLYTQFNHVIDAKGREIFQLNDINIPLFTTPTITLSPKIAKYNEQNSHAYNANRWPLFEGGTWADGSITFKSKHLGKFTVISDSIPPVITPKNKVKNTVYFLISDAQSGIGSFRATLNGNWVLMNYDHKRRLLWSQLQSDQQQFQGDFVLELIDKAGNKKIYQKKY